MEPEFWLDRWHTDRIGFHRDTVNPNLTRWWPELGLKSTDHILVPLCGKSLDLHWLAKRHSTTGVELAPKAVNAFWDAASIVPVRRALGTFEHSQHQQLTVLRGDFFDLEKSHTGDVHGFYDRASFIALPRSFRERYVHTLRRVLKPGAAGLVVTIEYETNGEIGPPFSISPEQVDRTLGPEFTIEPLSVTTMDAPGGLADRGVEVLKEHVMKVSLARKEHESL